MLWPVLLMVILNNHNSDPDWCCSLEDGNGLWFNRNYTERDWLASVWGLSHRYRHNPWVVAHDTRNEVRPAALPGSVAMPMWSLGSADGSGQGPFHSLRAASEKAADVVLQAAMGRQLVVIEPVEAVLLCELELVLAPLRVPCLSGRLVWSAHDYDWMANGVRAAADLCSEDIFGVLGDAIAGLTSQDPGPLSYAEFLSLRYIAYAHVALGRFPKAPLWIGEFGTDVDSEWWGRFLAYADQYDLDFAYWSLNGYAFPPSAAQLGDAASGHGQEETFGLLQPDHRTIRHPWVMSALRRVQGPRLGQLREGQAPRPLNSTGRIPL